MQKRENVEHVNWRHRWLAYKFDPVVALNEVLGSNSIWLYICHSGCACTVLQTVQRYGVCSAVYSTVYYKELLKSCDKSRV